MADEPTPTPEPSAPQPAATETGSSASVLATPAPAEPAAPESTPAPAAIDPAKLTMPQGFTPDETVIKGVTDVLLDDKLSPQDRMQKLVDLHASEVRKSSDAATKYWTDKQTEWKAEAAKTYGPEPAKSPKIIAVSKLIDSLGEKPAGDLRDALEMSGMGNHPAVIGAFVALAERLTESGTIVAQTPAKSRPGSFGEALYGNPT